MLKNLNPEIKDHMYRFYKSLCLNTFHSGASLKRIKQEIIFMCLNCSISYAYKNQ